MKKTLLLLSFIISALWLNAQTSLTVREVYDFDVNDEFQTHALNVPPNATRHTILSKRISANNDTVVYRFAYNNYSSTVSNTPSPHLIYNFSSGIDSVRYTKLDSLINYVGWPTDSCSQFHDSTYVSSTYCNALVYEYTGSSGMCFEGVTTTETYGKGLGYIGYHYQYPAMWVDNQWVLFYYRKSVSGVTCGTPDSTTLAVQQIKNRTKEIKIGPNPARTFCKVQLASSAEEYDASLIDVTGKTVWREKNKGQEINLDVSAFEEGVYFLQVKQNENIVSRKIVVQY
jgi:hypothetical protein